MAGLVSYSIFDEDENVSKPASGFMIADGFMLTAGHLYHEWDRSQSNPVIRTFGTLGQDYRAYGSAYTQSVATRIANGGPFPDNEDIEGELGATRDTIVVAYSGSVSNSDRGIVLFLNETDMTKNHLTSALGSSASVYRNAANGSPTDDILSVTSAGRLIFDRVSTDGDSGGAYVLRYGGREFIIGTHNGNLGADATGTYFLPHEWTSLNAFFEERQRLTPGNVTEREPVNLVVGTTGTDEVRGSYRADILLGREGDDTIDDGDEQGDSVWANDTLIGGAGNDTFKPGKGDDIIWGGDKDATAKEANVTDTVDYSNIATPLTVSCAGSTMTVSAGTDGTDTLHWIDEITGTDSPTDCLVLEGAAANAVINLTNLDANGYALKMQDGTELRFKGFEKFIGGESLTTFIGKAGTPAEFRAGSGGGDFTLKSGDRAYGFDGVQDIFRDYGDSLLNPQTIALERDER